MNDAEKVFHLQNGVTEALQGIVPNRILSTLTVYATKDYLGWKISDEENRVQYGDLIYVDNPSIEDVTDQFSQQIARTVAKRV